jgi:hypothetical protein
MAEARRMQKTGNLVDGRKLLASSPFRSWHFASASVTGLLCIVVDIYLLYRHRHFLNANLVCLFAIPIIFLLMGNGYACFGITRKFVGFTEARRPEETFNQNRQNLPMKCLYELLRAE